MDILSFCLGFASSTVFFLYTGIKFARSKKEPAQAVPTRTAIFERRNGRVFVYDEETHKFICEFTSWTELAEALIKEDENVKWFVKHAESYDEN